MQQPVFYHNPFFLPHQLLFTITTTFLAQPLFFLSSQERFFYHNKHFYHNNHFSTTTITFLYKPLVLPQQPHFLPQQPLFLLQLIILTTAFIIFTTTFYHIFFYHNLFLPQLVFNTTFF